MTDNRVFLLGEEKYLEFEAYAINKAPVIITSATYTLTLKGSVVEQGACNIVGNKITVLLNPPGEGGYVFELTYVVSDEIRKKQVNITVI